MKKYLLLLLLSLFFAHTQMAQLARHCFAEGDRVCFVGNSITHAGYYHNFVSLYYLLHYPQMQLETFNCGVSGNSASNVIKRMEVDILAKKPTVATVMLGMNDVNRELYKSDTFDTANLNARLKSIEIYKRDIDAIANELTDNNCRIIFLTPSIYDQESKIEAENMFGVNDALGICSQYLAGLAQKYNAKVVDFNGEMNTLNRKVLPDNPTFMLAGSDRVHPDVWGHFFMAYIFLKTLETPDVVSAIKLDYSLKNIVDQENCSISNLSVSQNGIRFNCLEKSLPFPVNQSFSKALNYCPFEDEYNRQLLSISNLPHGNYYLTIDNVIIDTLTNIEFEKGINLASYHNTPQYKQAEKVMNLSFERNALISGNLRNLAMFDYDQLLDMKNPGDVNEAKKLLAQRVEDCKGKLWYEYMKSVTQQYFENKPNEQETILKTQQIMDSIILLKKPKVHIYNVLTVI